MTTKEIDELFWETVNKTRALYNKIDGFTESVIFNWRHRRTIPSLGDKLSVLFQMGLIQIETEKHYFHDITIEDNKIVKSELKVK